MFISPFARQQGANVAASFIKKPFRSFFTKFGPAKDVFIPRSGSRQKLSGEKKGMDVLKNLGESFKTWGLKMRNSRENAALERQLKQATQVRTQARTAAQEAQTQTQKFNRHFNTVQNLLSNRRDVSQATEHSLRANQLVSKFRTLLKQRPHDSQLKKGLARAEKLKSASNLERKASLQSSAAAQQSLRHSSSSLSSRRPSP